MKKICFFVGNMNHSGGTERVSSVIINQFAAKGFDIHVVNLGGGESPFFHLDPQVKNISLGNIPGGGLKAFFSSISKLRSYIKAHSIDVLVSVESLLALYSVPAAFFTGVKQVVWEHFNYNVDLGLKARRFARHIAAFAVNDIVTLTEKDKGFWQKATWCRASVSAIANPVPFGISEHQPDTNNKTFLSVGRLTHQKGFDLLLQAWKGVAAVYPDWVLQIVGSGEDHVALINQIGELELGQSVQLIPATPEIKQYYQNAVYYVMSSRFEGLPMVLLEALSYGLPIVSFDCDTGPSDIVIHGGNGWLCLNGNPESLTKAMLEAVDLAADNTTYSAYSAEAKVKCKDYSVNSVMDKWISLVSDAEK